jgi:NO-binding membrane sensor protein with MHYT domain
VQGTYDIGLVLTSILVAAFASYAALSLAARVSLEGRQARVWILAGAMAMGLGIWSMHFIGMLAFSLPIAVAYDTTITLASLLIAVVTSGIALAVVAQLAMVSDAEVDLPILVAGGVIMGAGICGMHYTGMAAMRMMPPIQYTPSLFGLSMVIAISASLVALWLAFTLRIGDSARMRWSRIAAAIVMGLAITGMHYTAMAAANFRPDAICTATGLFTQSATVLGYGLAAVTLPLLAAAILAPRAAKAIASQGAPATAR